MNFTINMKITLLLVFFIFGLTNMSFSKRLPKVNLENEGKVSCVALSLDGRFLASSGRPAHAFRIWDCGERKGIMTYETDIEEIRCLDFSPDGSKLLVGGARGYKGSTKTNNLEIWDLKTGKRIQQFSGQRFSVLCAHFFNNGQNVVSSGYDKSVYVWDISSDSPVKKIFLDKEATVYSMVYYKHKDSGNDFVFVAGGRDKVIRQVDLSAGVVTKILKGPDATIFGLFVNERDDKLYSASRSGELITWNLTSNEIEKKIHVKAGAINCFALHPLKPVLITGGEYEMEGIKLWNLKNGTLLKKMGDDRHLSGIVSSKDGRFLIASDEDGFISIWNTQTGELLATLADCGQSDDYVVFCPNGQFDGSKDGMQSLYFVDGLEIIPLEGLFNHYFTPGLLSNLFASKSSVMPQVNLEDIRLPPIVKILSPENRSKSRNKTLNVDLVMTDQGGGIGDVFLYHNEKLLLTGQRAIKVKKKSNKHKLSFNVDLVNGANEIKVIALNNQGAESLPEIVNVTFKGKSKTADLHILAVGINEYKNRQYNLNYAVSDSKAFISSILSGGKNIYGKIHSHIINDNDATRENIIRSFEKLFLHAKPEDVFIFYYAGHGTMSMGAKPRFFLAPHELTDLYACEADLMKRGISAEELQSFSMKIQARKQLYVLDACQSGGMVEHLAMRGAAEEKAIAQLARSTGTFWIASSGSQQMATEFKSIGHGTFTFGLLEGLKGKADTGIKDQKITVQELSNYLEDMVPQLTMKHRGTFQYPRLFRYGMDFPLVMSGN